MSIVLWIVSMLNCLFYTIFFSLFINLSFGSLRMSQINRAFMSSFKGVYEASVVTVGKTGEPIYPYYDRTVFTKCVQTFIEENVSKYTTDYELKITFYLQDGITESNINNYARSAKVTLNAKINYLFNYSKTQQFTIKDKTIIWMTN